MSDPSLEGLKSYQECAKQVLTVSAGVMTLTVAFWDKIYVHGANIPVRPTTIVELSWVFFIVTDVLALWVLMATTGSLLAFDRKANGHTLSPSDQRVTNDGYVGNVNWPFGGMLVFFVLALACTAFAAH